tara:strand:+ start:321 stop:536 length:216 start_codon:yes stop_codon:yes gene_type:complete
MTQKAKAVQLQSAFLEFIDKARELGYELDRFASIIAHPRVDSKNSINNNVTLRVGDYVDKVEQVVFSTSKD